MNRIKLLVCAAALALSFSMAAPGTAQSPSTPAAPQFGAISGIVLGPNGVAVHSKGDPTGADIFGVREGGTDTFTVRSNASQGGTFNAVRVPAGAYDIVVFASEANGAQMAPTKIRGVVVSANCRTTVMITVSPGYHVREVDSPPVIIQPLRSAFAAPGETRAKLKSTDQSIRELQEQVLTLERQVEDLKAAMANMHQKETLQQSPSNPHH